MAEPKISKLIHLSIEQMAGLERLAEYDGVTVMDVIRKAIDAYILRTDALHVVGAAAEAEHNAYAELNRMADLHERGIGDQQELRAAETEYTAAATKYNDALRKYYDTSKASEATNDQHS